MPQLQKAQGSHSNFPTALQILYHLFLVRAVLWWVESIKKLKACEDDLQRISIQENCDRHHAGLPRVNNDLHTNAKMTATLESSKGNLGQTHIIIFNPYLIEFIT